MSLRRKWDPPPPQASVPSPRNQRGGTLACGWGVGESQFQRLEEKFRTVSTLWKKLFSAVSWPTMLSPPVPPGSRPPSPPVAPGSRPLALGVRVRDQPEGGAGGQAGGQDPGDQPDAHQPQQDIQQVWRLDRKLSLTVTTRKKIVTDCDD